MRRLRRSGLGPTARIAWSLSLDAMYDLRRCMWTLGRVDLRTLSISGARDHGEAYQATRVNQFFPVMRTFDVPIEGRFVDLGCGKGRVLVFALDYGFRSLAGVDFAQELATAARRNLSRRVARTGGRAAVDILCADAGGYSFRPDDRVLYLYNPFDAGVLSRVVANLERSLAMHPRDLWLLYANPLHRSVLDSCEALVQAGTYEAPGLDVVVYRSRSR